MNIYVASSWRNEFQPSVVKALCAAGHEVYDFRDPDGAGKDTGFSWADIDPHWQTWTTRQFINALSHPLAVLHFKKDYEAMLRADAIVMVMPCGRSAHFEAGWATATKLTAVLLLGPNAEPELMYKQASLIATSIEEVVDWLARKHIPPRGLGVEHIDRAIVQKLQLGFSELASSNTRPTWDAYFLRLATDVATRATCDRKHVGAVIVDDRRRIVSTGYNGAPAGMPHCSGPDGVGHEIKVIEGRPGCVRTLHAESNALDDAGRRARGGTLYVTVTPCYPCAQRLVNAGIARIVYGEWYDSQNTDLVAVFLENAGVELVHA